MSRLQNGRRGTNFFMSDIITKSKGGGGHEPSVSFRYPGRRMGGFLLKMVRINANNRCFRLFAAQPRRAVIDIDFERDVELNGAGHLPGDPFGVYIGLGCGQLE